MLLARHKQAGSAERTRLSWGLYLAAIFSPIPLLFATSRCSAKEKEEKEEEGDIRGGEGGGNSDINSTDFRAAIRSRKLSSCIIKLGGSACTVKNEFETYSQQNVKRFSEDLKKICSENSSYRPIVIHGAGSFGHFQAKSFSVNGGAISESGKPSSKTEFLSPFLREGFVKTRISVTGLNHRVVSTMGDSGLPAVGVSPYPYLPISNRRLVDDDALNGMSWNWQDTFIKSISTSLHMGLIPVLHGDACIDTTEKVTGILSGDTLFSFLCDKFKPSHAVFLTDVDGVYTAPPSSPNAELIDEIWVDDEGLKWKIVTASGTVLELDYKGKWHRYKGTSPQVGNGIEGVKSLEKYKMTKCEVKIKEIDQSMAVPAAELVTSISSHDVTGGMDSKIKAAIDVVSTRKIPVYIVRVASPSATAVLKGEKPEIGTTIKFQMPCDKPQANNQFRLGLKP